MKCGAVGTALVAALTSVSCFQGDNNPSETQVQTGIISPSVATNGRDYLVSWIEMKQTEATGVFDMVLRAAGVSADGEVTPTDLESHLGVSSVMADAVFDGSSYLVLVRGIADGPKSFRLNDQGAIVDSAFAIPAIGFFGVPRTASSKAGAIVIWSEASATGGSGALQAALISHANGFDAQVKLADDVASVGFGAASDGTEFLVAWEQASVIRATRVTLDGRVLDVPGIQIASTPNPASVAVAFDGTDYIVGWGSDTLVATRLTTSGQLLDPNGHMLGAEGAPSPLVGAPCGNAAIFVWPYMDYEGAYMTPDGVVRTLGLPSVLSYYASMAMAGNSNGCLAVWNQGGLHAARIAADGTLRDATGFVVQPNSGCSVAMMSPAGGAPLPIVPSLVLMLLAVLRSRRR